MKKIILAAILIAILIPAYSFGATVITSVQQVIEITTIDADWIWTDTFKNAPRKDGLKIVSIVFRPGAASDKSPSRKDRPQALSSSRHSRSQLQIMARFFITMES